MSKLRTIILSATLLMLFFTGINHSTRASHLTAIDLFYEHIQGDSFKVVLKLYRDCSGISISGTQNIDITSNSCGLDTVINVFQDSVIEVSQLCPSQIINSTCNGSGSLPGVQEYTFSTIFEFPFECDDWVISYESCARNAMITNIFTPDNECMYVEAVLDNTDSLFNNSPVFTTIPLVYACSGIPFTFNHGGIDSDGDSLVFSLVTPMTGPFSTVTFISPNSATYPVLDNRGFNDFDPVTGEMIFEPSSTQVAVTAIRIDEYRDGVLIGSVMRDLQMIIRSCANSQPSTTTGIMNESSGTVTGTNQFAFCNGDSISFDIGYQDPDASDEVSITSNIGQVIPGATYVATIGNPASISIQIPPSQISGKKTFTVTVIDDGCDIYTSQVYTYVLRFIPTTRANNDQVIFCPGGITAELNATGGSTFTWSTLSGDPIVVGSNFSCNPCANPIPTPDSNTVYEVTSNLNAGCGNKDTVAVNVVPGFTATIDSVPYSYCFNDTVQLKITPNDTGTFTFAWLPEAIMNNPAIDTPTATLIESETIYGYVTNTTTGCTIEKSIGFYVADYADTIDLPDSLDLCTGDSVLLEPNIYAIDENICDEYEVTEIPTRPETDFNSWSLSSVSNCYNCMENNVPIGFQFNYFCNTYSSVNISSSGYLTFGSGTSSTTPQTIPDVNTPNNIIALFWSDLNPAFSGNILYKTEVNPDGFKTFKLRFANVRFNSGSGAASGRIYLNEKDQSIELYIDQVIEFFNSLPKTSGIENQDGTVAYALSGKNNVGWQDNNRAFRFSLPTPAYVNNFIYSWSPSIYMDDSTSTTPTIVPYSSTKYYLHVTDSAGGCIDMIDSIDVKTTNNATPVITLSDDSLCIGESVSISGSGGLTYEWNTNFTGTSFTATPLNTITYTLIADSGNGCIDTTSATVHVFEAVNQLDVTPATDLCIGDSLFLEAEAYDNIYCAQYDVQLITAVPIISPTNVSTVSTCSDCFQNNVPIGFDFDFYCNSYNSVSISSEGFISFDMLGSSFASAQTIPSTNAPNNLIALCWTNMNPQTFGEIRYGTTGTPGNRIFTVAYEDVVSGSFFSGIINGYILLFESDNHIEIHLDQASGGFGTTARTLGIENSTGTSGESPPIFNNGLWTAFNTAYSFTPVTASNYSINYNWNPSIYLDDTTSATPKGVPLTTQMYYVEVSHNPEVCPSLMDSVLVNVYSYPNIQADASEDTICPDGSITLTATGGLNYSWNTGQNSDSITISPAMLSTYIVTGDSGYNCSSNDTVIIDFFNTAPPVINANPTSSICIGDTTTLTASGAVSYIWSTGNTTSNIAVSPVNTSTYTVTGTDGNACETSSSISVVVFSNAIDSISGPDTICVGEDMTLTTLGGNTYSWSNDSTNSEITEQPKFSQLYWVRIENAQGCVIADSHFISVLPSPIPEITGDTQLYFGDITQLMGNAQFSYLWSTNETTPSIFVSPDSSTFYSLLATNEYGCTGTDSIWVIINPEKIIPNIITPNGDPENEYFELRGFRQGGLLQVFNRWGKLVYENESYSNNFNAEGLEEGTYFYMFTPIIQQDEEAVETYKGWITVRR